MINGVRLPRILLRAILLLTLWICSCAAGVNVPSTGTRAGSLPGAARSVLPTPHVLLARILRQPSDIDEPLFKSGSANEATLPAQAVSSYGNRMNFFPEWTAGEGLDATAYCGYCFDLTGYTDPVEISCCFSTEPEASGLAFLGVGNLAKNAWDWFAVPLCGVVALDDTALYRSVPGSLMIVMLVVIGDEQVTLANIRVGNVPPDAQFTLSTGLGLPGTTVEFDGSASSDPDGNIYRWQWDPEGDGTYQWLPIGSHGSAYKSFTYSQPGTYHPKLKITDDSGAVDTFSDDVQITMGNLYVGTLDATQHAGMQCSAALVDGKAAVAYMRDDELCYMHALDNEAFNWSEVKVIDPISGGNPDLAVIAGRPAIAFQSGGLDLGYVRANTASGSSWPVPQIAYYKTSVPIGFYPSLAEIGGLPAIVHGDQEIMAWGGNLWYLRATTVDGGGWLAVAQVNKPGTQGTEPALGLVGGIPVVSFLCRELLNTNYVECARANDALGNTWPWPTVAFGSGMPWCNGNALLDTAGRPAIGFLDTTQDKLQLARCRDETGVSWYAPYDVADPSGSCYGYSLLNINGLPCCAYDDSDAGLCYVIAESASGVAWNEPLVVDAAASPSYISMLQIYGLPAIAYYDGNSDSLKFAIYI